MFARRFEGGAAGPRPWERKRRRVEADDDESGSDDEYEDARSEGGDSDDDLCSLAPNESCGFRLRSGSKSS